jgi:hypothetical protein
VAMFPCWRHMHRQFLLMLHPRPEQVVVDVEAVVRDNLSTASSAATAAKDLPPKHEEVAGICFIKRLEFCFASFRFEAKITKAKRSEKFETKISEKKRKKRSEIL